MDQYVEKLIENHKLDKDLTNEQNYITTNCTDWTNVNLEGWNLQGIDFGSANKKVDFSGAILINTFLNNCTLNGAKLSNVVLNGANLRNARLISADLSHSHLKETF